MKKIDEKLQAALTKAIQLAGSQVAFAKLCGKNVKQPHISQWLKRNRNKGLPVQYVIAVEKGLNGKMTREELRPDLYPIEN